MRLCICTWFITNAPRSSPRWRLLLYEKSVGICICYRPTAWGFSHCPLDVGRQRRSPRLYMQSMRPTIFLPKYRAESKIITYPRASTVAQSLTSNWKVCEKFWTSRISADKRFLMYVHYIPHRLTPDRGFCETVCAANLQKKHKTEQLDVEKIKKICHNILLRYYWFPLLPIPYKL